MILTQDITKRYLFFSYDSYSAGKNEFVSQFTCFQPHLHVKYKS